MSEQGNFSAGNYFGPEDIGIPYPRPAAVHLVATDIEVAKSQAFQEDDTISLDAKLPLIAGLKKYLGSKHKLSPSDTSIALIAYQDNRTEAQELARTQDISEPKARAIARVTDYICSPRRAVAAPGAQLKQMRQAAHAN